MIYLGIAIVIFLFIFAFRRPKKTEANYDSEYIYDEKAFNDASSELIDFEENYFNRIKNGELHQQFLIIGGQQDCSIIRSLLAADNIPSYIENENVNRMYGGTPTAVTGVFAIKLFILVNDYDKAYDIVCDYAKSKKEEFDEYSDTPHRAAKATSEIITGLFFTPYPVNSEQKSMGITILPKLEQ